MQSVERPRPVLKGLKLCLALYLSLVSRKTLPCSKGIETRQDVLFRLSEYRRKTPPCSKGIETVIMFLLRLFLCRKTLPCSKGIEAFKVKPGKNPQECVVCNTQKTGNTKC